jgi:hypothetical protein
MKIDLHPTDLEASAYAIGIAHGLIGHTTPPEKMHPHYWAQITNVKLAQSLAEKFKAGCAAGKSAREDAAAWKNQNP